MWVVNMVTVSEVVDTSTDAVFVTNMKIESLTSVDAFLK
jgi:hypothetical protein